MNEREHWLSITDDPEWRRNHINDPNIPLKDTLEALTFHNQPERIVEIGCGYGRLTTEIAAMYPFAHVTGIDINPKILPANTDRITYLCQDTLDGLDGQDAIYSVAVFQHLTAQQKRDYIFDAERTLNPGGILRIQFIEGDRDNPLDRWVHAEEMESWMSAAGLDVAMIDHGLAHPQWTWITGIK